MCIWLQVKHAMTKEGVDESIIDLDPEELIPLNEAPPKAVEMVLGRDVSAGVLV